MCEWCRKISLFRSGKEFFMTAQKDYQMVDRQINEWLERNTKISSEVTKKTIPPVITISEEWGAGGSQIAQLIKKELGDPWRVWGKQIVGEIAKRADVRNEIVKSIEDNAYSRFESFFKGFFTSESFTQNEYRRHVTNILLALGHHGYAVILGRGSNFVLPRAFRVRIVASRKYRVNTLQKQDKVSEEEALYLMRQSDHEKSEFIKQVFNENINDPWNYDMCIKTNYIKPETAAKSIIESAKDKLGKLK